MDEFDILVEKAAEFPPLDGRLSALESYVNNLEEFINVTCDQTEIRLKAHANREEDPVAQAEIESEALQLQSIGRLEFSSTICGSVLVSVYFAYEASVTKIFNHLARKKSLVSFDGFKEKQIKRIKEQNGDKVNFLLVADTYSHEILRISLFGNRSGYFVLEELRGLRNSYVHNGCSLESLSERTNENIKNGKYELALCYGDSKWCVTPFGGINIFQRGI